MGTQELTIEMLEPLVVLLKCQDVTVQRPATRAISNFALLGPGKVKGKRGKVKGKIDKSSKSKGKRGKLKGKIDKSSKSKGEKGAN